MAIVSSSKLTQRDFYTALIETLDSGCIPEGFSADTLTEFLNSRLAQLDKKATPSKGGERKPTARQAENEGLKSAVLANMEADTLYTIGEMLKNFDCFGEEMTSQRLNAIVSQMYADPKREDGLTKGGTAPTIERIEEKRKAYFRKIAD